MMGELASVKSILIAEDDPDDQYFLGAAVGEVDSSIRLAFVDNGQSIMDYLNQCLQNNKALLPSFIMLDLNMPILDGLETLKQVKLSEDLCHIPVIIFTTSQSETDIKDCYRYGANTYVVKPITFPGVRAAVKNLCKFWLETAELIKS